jgi:hypothetical protein
MDYNEEDLQDTSENLDEDTTADEVDYKSLYEQEKARADKEAEMRRGLVSKVKQTKTQTNTPAYDDARLDKIELRQLDKDLTSEQVDEILTYKKAKGVDVYQAYSSSLIQAFLKDQRANKEQEEKINKATPRASNRSAVTNNNEPQRLKTDNNWVKNPPPNPDRSVDKVAEEIQKRFFTGNN